MREDHKSLEAPLERNVEWCPSDPKECVYLVKLFWMSCLLIFGRFDHSNRKDKLWNWLHNFKCSHFERLFLQIYFFIHTFTSEPAITYPLRSQPAPAFLPLTSSARIAFSSLSSSSAGLMLIKCSP